MKIAVEGAALNGASATLDLLMQARSGQPDFMGGLHVWPPQLRTLCTVIFGAKQPMFIAWGAGRHLLYNDGYAQILGERHPRAFGRPMEEVWSDVWDVMGPLVDSTFAGQPWHEDNLPLLITRNGRRVQTHFAFSYTPVRADDGPVLGVFCVCTETTQAVASERARNTEEKRRLQLFQNAPGFMTILRGPAHVFEFANDAFSRLVGGRELIGRTVREALPEVENQGFYELLDKVYTSGQPFVASGRPIRLWPHPGATAQERLVDFVYAPITEPDGSVTGIFVEGNDVTERLQAQAELRASHARYKEVLDSMGDGFVVMDESFRLVEINAEGLRIDGRPARDMLGHSHWDLWPASIGTPVEAAYRKVMSERVAVELRHHHVSDRQDMWLHIRAYPVSGGIASMYRDITQAVLTETAMRQSDERFRAAVAAIGVLWTNDASGQMIGDQPGWAQITGQTREQYQGHGWANALHPDDAQPTLAAWQQAVAERRVFVFEHRLRLRDGQWRRFAVRAVPILLPDGRVREWVGVHIDITEAAAAAEANAKFRTFFEQGSYFASLLALDGTVIEANRICVEGCGFERPDVIGHKFWDCGWWAGHPELMARVREATHEAATGRSVRCETSYHLADGNRRFVDLSVTPVKDEAGRVLFIAPTGVDISDAKQAAEGLRRLAAELAEADQRKTEFLATLAHELRNPLAPLRNGLQVMRMARDNALVVTKAHDMMERQLAQMVRLIDDLLDVARIARGKLELKRERVALHSVVASAVETSMPLVEAGRHELLVQLPDEPLMLDADPTRLAQVLSNLLNNAAKYTPPGGRIVLNAQRVDTQAVVSVADNGIGIPADSLTRVFEMFTRVGREDSLGQSGLGIGLSLVRQLVELHGGSATAASPGPGQGSTLTLRLPLLARVAAEPTAPHTPAEPSANANPALRVLVVDDNLDAAESLAELLQLHGHTTTIGRDGHQALALAEGFAPDVVFLDIGMPGFDGYQVAHALRASPGADHVTLVALTGWGGLEDRQRARLAGFDEHLTKPADPAAIEQLLARVSHAPRGAR